MIRALPITLVMLAALAACDPNTDGEKTMSEGAQVATPDADALADIDTSDVAGITE